ncbi:hypothetical protein [Pseudoalteromonas luteoviolacea]|uniref:hypothetical protein n=1 Tax=Pseudoalteromonas luteoviolacea TaxID=43657 RepID=UPI00114DEFB7|nr:hypothetical protein [Pseudoalteromonas luteoviolacea]TQF70083.1 hypothetical protein FLM44_03040 [Pseudoalteromonas luteoviolacea]
MSAWDILKIQQTNDIKVIKVAYAKQLKVCRPESHPEEFQALHQAYKSALNWAKSITEEHFEAQAPLDNMFSEQPEVIEAAEMSDTVDDVDRERQAELDEMHIEYKQHIEEISKVFDDKVARNDISAWRFLQQSQSILDPEYNTQLGMFVFESILKINKEFEQLSRKKKRYSGDREKISIETILYLDGVFNWRSQVNALCYFFGEQDTVKVLNLIETHAHKPDSSLAIDSVQGAKVIGKRTVSTNQADENLAAVEALARLKSLTYRSFCVCLLLCGILMTAFMDQGIDGGVLFLRIFIVVHFVQMLGVAIRNKYIIYSMWPVSILFILCFPIMTLTGIAMLSNLRKVKVYFKYEQKQ